MVKNSQKMPFYSLWLKSGFLILFLVLLYFILYWFLISPLVFVKFRSISNVQVVDNKWQWDCAFWLVALFLFCFLLGLLLYCCTYSPKSDILEEVKVTEELFPNLNDSCIDQMLDKCELRIDDSSASIGSEDVTESMVLSPLTPRELFFQDLIENAKSSPNSNSVLSDSCREFFIANVSPTTVTQSDRVFCYINANSNEILS